MRHAVLVLGIVLASVAFVAPPQPAAAATVALTMDAGQATQPAPGKDINVDIDVHRGGGWYASPVWIGIGVVAAILLVLIIALVVRGGGGTTIIKE
jgi:hypothetical protein